MLCIYFFLIYLPFPIYFPLPSLFVPLLITLFFYNLFPYFPSLPPGGKIWTPGGRPKIFLQFLYRSQTFALHVTITKCACVCVCLYFFSYFYITTQTNTSINQYKRRLCIFFLLYSTRQFLPRFLNEYFSLEGVIFHHSFFSPSSSWLSIR